MSKKSNLPAARPSFGSLVASINPRTKQGDLVDHAIRTAGGDESTALKMLADCAIRIRNQDIAMLGNGEAFVRRTPEGNLIQVVEVVELSTAVGDLYHIAQWGKVDGKRCHVNEGYNSLTVQGIEKINAVASVMTGQTPTVVVDGMPRTNPFIERTPDGGIRRIVVGVQVVGPSPATGQPVLVQYVLDYDPRKDFLHMLAEVEKNTDWSGGKGPRRGNAPEHCRLVSKDEVKGKPGTKFVELYDGVGYLVDLRAADIREVYSDLINLLMNAPKKALTVARRNALLKHPAIGRFKTVAVDAKGNARIGVRGWAGDSTALQHYQQIANQIARGIPVDERHFEVIEAEQEVYEPERHAQGIEDEPDDISQGHTNDAPTDDDTDERAALILTIDQLISQIPPDEVEALGYDPDNNSTEQLRGIAKNAEDAASYYGDEGASDDQA